MVLEDLLAKWRDQATEAERWLGEDDRTVRVIRTHADELEAALQVSRDEVLTLGEAAFETRYTTDHLSELVRLGVIPNAGRKGAPRIRRRDLPPPKKGRAPVRPIARPIGEIAARLR